MSLLNKDRLKRWRKIFEETMHAATFAEANEHEIAKEFLKGELQSPETVLLVVTGDTANKRALDYASNLCKNTDCYLTVMKVTDASNKGDLEKLKQQLQDTVDVPWSFMRSEDQIHDAVSRFLKEQGQVVSVILEAPHSTNTKITRRRSWWRNLYCPVVVVA